MLRTYGLVTALARSAVLAYAKVLSFSESDKPVSFFYQPAEERGELLEKQGRTLFFQEAIFVFSRSDLVFFVVARLQVAVRAACRHHIEKNKKLKYASALWLAFAYVPAIVFLCKKLPLENIYLPSNSL